MVKDKKQSSIKYLHHLLDSVFDYRTMERENIIENDYFIDLCVSLGLLNGYYDDDDDFNTPKVEKRLKFIASNLIKIFKDSGVDVINKLVKID